MLSEATDKRETHLKKVKMKAVKLNSKRASNINSNNNRELNMN